MKQLTFLQKEKCRLDHGGVLAFKKRRSKRPINIKKPVHLVMRSDLAKGSRSLLKNQKIVLRVLEKFSQRFHVRVYEKAICGKHIHCLVKGSTRKELQHFFRVFAGQVAQEILRSHPLELQNNEQPCEPGGTPRGLSVQPVTAQKSGCSKNQRTFWSLLLYSRVVSWGRDYSAVKAYVIRNTLEALRLIPFKTRKRRDAYDVNLQ